jgi:phage regulator Rha-like protein
MNQLTAKGVVTMSSREFARLVQSKHGDVKRSAERLASAGILTAPLAHTPTTPAKRANIRGVLVQQT